MEYRYLTFLFLFWGSLAFCSINAGEPAKRLISFDDDWYFRLENPGNAADGQTDWSQVCVPHDWSVELPFTEIPDGGVATGHKAGGTAWYKKNFILAYNDVDKFITLCFDGVYMGVLASRCRRCILLLFQKSGRLEI